jgi:hypothetical protein
MSYLTDRIVCTQVVRSLQVSAGAGLILLFSSTAAAAYGKRGNFSVGIERLFGVYSDHTAVEQRGGADQTVDTTELGFLYQAQPSAFAIPRVTFDYFLIDNLSLGAGLGAYSFSSTDLFIQAESGYILAPRVGYNFTFNGMFGVQPHAGFTYVHSAQRLRNVTDDLDSGQLAVALDGMFYFMPAPNVGISGTVIADVGISGSQQDAAGNITDRHERLFGVAFGMFAHF